MHAKANTWIPRQARDDINAGAASRPRHAGLDPASIDDEDAAPEEAACFFTKPLPEPGPEWRTVPIARLVEFFRNPSQFILRRRLIFWQPDASPLD